MIIELRSDPEAMSRVSPDMVDLWGTYIERWSATAAAAESAGAPFRWSEQIDPEVGEFLLHGLDRCLHSPFIRSAATPDEAATHKPFTMTVVQAFVDGLSSEGESSCHYVDQVLTSFNDVLHE